MFKVLAVDDDALMRTMYRELFHWESVGFSLVALAHDGEDALETIKTQDIDLVITDLKMPNVTGLEFIERAKQEKPHLKFIVMSGFDEFHLVNAAYKFGIDSYFLKVELDPEALLNTLRRIGQEIVMEQEQAELIKKNKQMEEVNIQRLRRIEKIVDDKRWVLTEHLLKNLFWNYAGNKSIDMDLRSLAVPLSCEELCVAVIHLEGYYKVEQESWHNERELLKFGIYNVLDEVCLEFGSLFAFSNMPHEYVLLFSYKDNRDLKMESLYAELKERIKFCFNMDMHGGLSLTANGYKECKNLYMQALSACEYYYLEKAPCLIEYRYVLKQNKSFEPDWYVMHFKKLLNTAITETFRTEAKLFYVDGQGIAQTHIADIKELFHTYYYELRNYLNENKLDANEELQLLLYHYETQWKESGTLEEHNEWLANVLEAIAKGLGETKLISRVKSFVEKEYDRNITLYDLAEHLGMSRGYLSRIFKQETGLNFNTYLLDVRIKKAIELMKNTEYKVYEIAAMVGYINTEHFSRSFKKVTGKTPKEYLK